MSMQAQEPKKGVPVARVLMVLGTIGVIGLVLLGTRGMFSQITLHTPPVVGEWESPGKPWHLSFRPDKTVVSKNGPVQELGTYSINYFGTLWVKLGGGRLYTAELHADMPNRFDLIETDTEVPTVFKRIEGPQPEASAPAQVR
jgi:hypothetical protein